MNFCVDQRGFRSKKLEQLIDTTGGRFVVADAALMEMCKSTPHWESTLRNSLRRLSAVPARVCFVPGNGECLKAELTTRTPLTLKAMISDQQTFWLRELLAEVASGQFGAMFTRMVAEIDAANRHAQAQHFAHEQNLAQLRVLVDFCRDHFPASFVRRLRAKRVPEEEYIRFVSRYTATATNDAAMSLPDGTLGSLAKSKAYTMRWLWLRVETVADWLAKGGIDSVAPDKVTNSEVDNHYLAVASYCDQLLTEDGRMLEKQRRLRAAIRLTMPWKRAWREEPLPTP
ncbi:hypothetical protein [Frateuria sp. Soil773]|uniref:hypothetical protein n=1 Tax=Frateuria sp. Soil773 TaxID=1736407 RepID=UPI0012FB3B8B|nr:hypothetical protein [Frateuria sp. Soil773]